VSANPLASARLRAWLPVYGFSFLFLTASVARADSAAAEILFREGRRLLLNGKIAEACAKLDESQRLDPSSGTLMNLAYCHKKLGRSATAWAEFLQAERLSLAQRNQARASEAKRQAAALEPELSRLTIRVASMVPDMTISRNGELLTPSALGVPLPLDRGHYQIRLQAPGYGEWRTDIDIDAPGEHVLDVPALEPEKPPPFVEPAPASTPRTLPATGAPNRLAPSTPALLAKATKSHSSRASAPSLPAGFWVASAAGVAAAGFATTFGILSLSSYGRAEEACNSHEDCSPTSVRDGDKAKTQARVADVGWLAAIAAVAVASYVYFDTHSQGAPAIRRSKH
jgi:hypothetical protein